MNWFDLLQKPEWIWVRLGVSAAVAVLITLMICGLLRQLLKRVLNAHRPVLSALFQRCYRGVRLALVLFVLELVWASAPDDLPLIGLLHRLTALGLVGALTWAAARGVNAISVGIASLYPLDVADNLYARRVQTQTRVLTRTISALIGIIGVSAALMTFPAVRQFGTSLLASAGLAGLVVGFAAKPVLGNVLAGLQIALTQPISIDDVVIVEGEWGRIEEITGAYVVVAIWDQRRLVVPLTYFIEKPFQNWTRSNAEIIGTVFWWFDYRLPLEPLRAELERVCRAAPEWDGRFFLLQVTDTTETTMQLRALVTAADSPKAFDLRCRVREAIVDFVQREYPDYLPTRRVALATGPQQNAEATAAPANNPDIATPPEARV